MNTVESYPLVVVKKKSIQFLLDYCLENKVEFTVSPKNSEEFKVVFILKDYTSAIALGMCLRELKIELVTAAELTSVAAIKAKKASNGNGKEHAEKSTLSQPVSMTTDSLSFDLDAMN